MLGVTVALLVSAVATGAASAKPKALYLEAGEPPGPVRTQTLWEFGLGKLVLEASDGTSTVCPGEWGNQLEGEVLATGATDIIELPRTYLDLKGRISPPCERSVISGVEHDVYLGLAPPKTVSLHANGKASMTGTAGLSITVVTYPAGMPSLEVSTRCSYQAAKYKLAEKINGPLSLTVSGVLKRTMESPGSCAKKMTLIDEGPEFATDSVPGPFEGEEFFAVDAWVELHTKGTRLIWL